MREIAGWILSANVSAKPDPGGLPGSNVVEQLVNGIFFFTLMGCVAAILVGAVLWAFGSRGNNPQYAAIGRTGVLGGFIGALFAGAAPALINFASHLGGQVH